MAHYQDLVPYMAAREKEWMKENSEKYEYSPEDYWERTTYKTIDYVRAEVTSLARQLASL